MADEGYNDDGSFPLLLFDLSLDNSDNQGNSNQSSIGGRRVYGPSDMQTFTARGLREYINNELTTMSELGYPDLILTFQSNPYWPEVLRYVQEYNIEVNDTSEIVLRVFKKKLDGLTKYLVESGIFGYVLTASWVIDFSSGEFPKALIFIYLEENSKILTPQEADQIISAEIPFEETDPVLHEIVKTFMIVRQSTTGFPIPFATSTYIDVHGNIVYKRRDNGSFVVNDGLFYDNRSLQSYNPTLSIRYRTHLSVKLSSNLVEVMKLLRQIFDNARSGNSTSETTWSRLGYNSSFRQIPVVTVDFHLPSNAFDNGFRTTQFLKWMEFNRLSPRGRDLTYKQFVEKFVWDITRTMWLPRRTGRIIGRLAFVPNMCGELYFLRVLLMVVKGAICFEQIRTVRGVVCETFEEACRQYGLIE